MLLIGMFLIPKYASAQNYVDILEIGYAMTTGNAFEGTNEETQVTSFEANLTLPIVLDKNYSTAIITGAIFSLNRLQLFPSEKGMQTPYTNLYSTTLKIGLDTSFNDKLGMTLVMLPKMASDYSQISGNDLFFGGYGFLKLKKRDNLVYRLGVYSSTEAFGFYTTPIIGWYSLSENKKLEMDMYLPISADINYTSGQFTYGFSYFGIGRSFNIEKDNSNTYVQLNALEFAGYFQFNNLFKNIILRAKAGYSTDDYEVHNYGDKIGFGFIAFNFNDDREQLNPKINGSLFFKLEAVYRFKLKNNQN